MKLSPLDIRKQEFTRAFRGYEVDEVDAFLHMVSDQWQELVDELQRARDRISEQDMRLDHYKKVEEALEVALKTARTSARQTIENAEEKARAILESAESNSVSIQRKAEEERLRLKKDTARFEVRQQEIVAKLRAFLISEMEMLAHFEGDSPTGFIKLMPSQDERALAKAYLEDERSDDPSDEDEDARFVDEADEEDQDSGDVRRSEYSAREVDEWEEEDDEEDERAAAELEEAELEEDGDEEPEYDVHRIYQGPASTTAEPAAELEPHPDNQGSAQSNPDDDQGSAQPEPEDDQDSEPRSDATASTTAHPDPNDEDQDNDDAHLRRRPSRHQHDVDADASDEIKKIRKILEDLDK